MASFIRLHSGIYYVVASVKGRRVWRSTGVKTRRKAEEVARTLFPELLEPPRRWSLTRFSNVYFPYAKANLAPSTVLMYQGTLNAFRRLMGDKSLRSYTIQEIEQYKIRRLAEVSATKVNMDFRFLKAFFQNAVKWGYIERNPCAGVKVLKIPPRRPVFFTKAEFQLVLNGITETWFREIILFAVSTMMRVGEIVNLTWDCVDLSRRFIMVENTDHHRLKNHQPHAVPMNDCVYSMLVSRPQKEGHVFTLPCGRRLLAASVSHKFKKAIKKAGLGDEYHFHSLRHTGATWLVQDGVSLFAVQRLLGHSNIQVTMMYSHLVTSEMQESVNHIQFANN